MSQALSPLLQAHHDFLIDQTPGLNMHEAGNGGDGTFSYAQVRRTL